MGCGSSKENQVLNDEDSFQINNTAKREIKKMKNEKIKITEDPEQQGEKFHLDEKGQDDDDDDEKEEGEQGEKDSFDEF